MGPSIVVAKGRCEEGARLVSADDVLASLQRGCGGTIPGTLAIPELLALSDKAWRRQVKLARSIRTQDGENQLTAWAEAVPDEAGCAISLSNLRAAPLPQATAADPGDAEAEEALLAQLAELHLRLDARQQVVAVGHVSPRLAVLAADIGAGIGKAWTDFLEVAGSSHRLPLHWRLLDGGQVRVPGQSGAWTARIVPAAGGSGAGFDLYLVPSAIDALPPDPRARDNPAEALEGMLGRTLAPALRQPIARIIANAETIRSRLAGPLADEYANYAADIADAARLLQSLVEDLADLDAIEAIDFKPAPDRIDLADAARRAAGILSVRAAERRITLETPGEDITAPAVGEFRRVLQVLLNLIGNALRYAPEGSTVRVTVEGTAVTVADEGRGLTPDEQARVFDKFERLGRSGDGGSGLGLYISRRLARAMGGDLTVAGAAGEGARFTLTLPAA